MSLTEKVYLKHHRQIAAQLETSIPKGVFSGATLDLLFQGEGLDRLDDAHRDRVLAFAEDFLDCTCEGNPYCGCPERKFLRYVMGLRMEGHGPEAIVDIMTDDYLVYAYPGDVLSFLEDAIRTLEAIEDVARIEGRSAEADRAAERVRALAG